MAKSPAINWYFDNWTGGTFGMSRFHKGCYMDLLAAQYHIGPLSLEQIKNILGSDFTSAWQTLQTKFVQDECKNFFNERLAAEVRKRLEYSESRRQNRKNNISNNICKTYDEDMKNTPEIDIDIKTEIKNKAPNLFFDLSEIEIEKSIEYLNTTAQKKFKSNELSIFFEAFKIQYEGNEFYLNRGKMINHFRDWMKKQSSKSIIYDEKKMVY